MTKSWIVVLFATLTSATHAAEDSVYVFSRAESFSYSEASPVTAYIDFLIGPAPEGGDVAFSRNNIELGMGYKDLELSLVHRNDYNLRFSPDAAEFSYLNKNRKTIPLGQDYDIDVWANQYQMSGAKLGYKLKLAQRFKLVMAYSHLWGTEAVSGYLGKDQNGNDGVIQMVEREVGGRVRKVIEGSLYADYFYTDDPLFEREVESPVGQGYAVDLGFEWEVTDNLHLSGMVQDVAGEMRWDNMPFTSAKATSEVIIVDDEGFLEANPNFEGFEGFGRFKQKFTERKLLSARYQWHKVLVGYQYEGYEVAEFNRLLLGYHWSERWGVDIASDIDTAAGELRFWTPVGSLSFTTDELDIDNARTLGFTWNLRFGF